MPWTCTRCESINVDADLICEVCDEPQPRNTHIKARVVTAGGWHSLAITDGTVVGWGLNDEGQTNIPTALSDVVAVSSRWNHCLALKSDGTVVAWGANNYGQTNVPKGLSNVIAVAAGWGHSLVLNADNKIIGWGRNNLKQLVIPTIHKKIIDISAGGTHALALTDTGTVISWGDNGSGQVSVPSNNFEITAIAAGVYHSLALKSNGTVIAWGDHIRGQTNIPTGLTDVTAIAAGAGHSLALKADGTVVAWGENLKGQTKIPPELSGVIAIAAGTSHSLALRADGTIVVWGGNDYNTKNVPPKLLGKTDHILKLPIPPAPIIDTAAKSTPPLPPPHPYEIGITLYKSKNYTAAFTYFTKHIKLLRNSVTIHSLTPDIFLLANALFWVGCVHYQRGEFDRALQVLSESLPLSRKLVATRGLPDDIRNLSELLYVIQKTALRI